MKLELKRQKRNFLYQIAGSIYVALISMILSIFIARSIGPAEFGLYSFILTIISITAIAQDGGFKVLIYRENILPTNSIKFNNKFLLNAGFGYLLIITFILFVLVYFIAVGDFNSIIIAIAFQAVMCLVAFISSLLKSRDFFTLDAIWQTIVRTSSFICVVIFILIGFKSPLNIFFALLIGSSIPFFIPIFSIYVPTPKFILSSTLFKNALPLAAIDFATLLYVKSDIVMLWYFTQASDVGLYSAGYRIITLVSFLFWPISQIWFKQLRSSISDRTLFIKLLNKMLLCMVIFSIILIIFINYFVSPAIDFILGDAYFESVKLIKIFSLSLIFTLPGLVLTQAAIAINLEKIYLKIAFSAAVINIVLNSIFIPRYGPVGAALTTVITELFLSLSFFFIIKIRWGILPKNSNTQK